MVADLLTVSDLVRILGRPRRTIQQWLKLGKLKGKKVVMKKPFGMLEWCVSKEDLREWMKKHGIEEDLDFVW